jgi:uncharacterized protein
MDIFLLALGFILLLTGLAGAVLPLPGPPLSFLGILAISKTTYANFETSTIWTLGAIALLISILDYNVPIWGTKKFGGSKFGVYGSGIGLLIGMFLGPFGLFIGAFIGAFVGEYIATKNIDIAFKAAIGSFLGLMAGIVVKVAFCVGLLVFAIIGIYP